MQLKVKSQASNLDQGLLTVFGRSHCTNLSVHVIPAQQPVLCCCSDTFFISFCTSDHDLGQRLTFNVVLQGVAREEQSFQRAIKHLYAVKMDVFFSAIHTLLLLAEFAVKRQLIASLQYEMLLTATRSRVGSSD